MSTLYNFRDNWSASVSTILACGGTGVPTANILTPRSAITAALPRLEVQFTGGVRASYQMVFSSTLGRYYYAHHEGELSVKVVTDRETASPAHGSVVGRVDFLMSYQAQRFVSPAVSYYELHHIQKLASAVGVEEDEREDATELRYAIDFSILPIAITTAS